MNYETLFEEALGQVYIYEKPMNKSIKGLQSDNVIWINKCISTKREKLTILAEELGHYHTSYGNILDQSSIQNKKQELRARQWAYFKLFPLSKIIQAHKAGIRNKYEFAEYLGVTEEFLESALQRYQDKYGDAVEFRNVTICFNPLGVVEWFDF
ncbi:ImmA/IrrE family metallo-endopeptidase [Sutcliffiella sp. BMC8]|uniref:ImmA/IrrE family metallo-endopeptidase n=1 Tax=Sutcliffiella sp. BMC8 TaxID=3073243 RepID=UPI0030CC17EE